MRKLVGGGIPQSFLHEIREVSVLFLNLQQLEFASSTECGEKMQNVVLIAQVTQRVTSSESIEISFSNRVRLRSTEVQ